MFRKSALNLLNQYSGDSSDSDSPEDKPELRKLSEKVFKLPVPQFVKTGNTNNNHIDDVSQHEGRIRSFAHERGNWATFVYIPFKDCDALMNLCSYIVELVPESLNLNISNDFHISLTKTVVLKYHWISPFVKTLKDNLQGFKKFLILFDNIEVYCNEERTRTFLGIQIKTGFDKLKRIVQILDLSLEEFDLPAFYQDPSFHMSIAWCIGDYQNHLKQLLSESINQKLEQDNWYIFVEALHCKIGNKQFQFKLD